jgi:hypothetical protein
MNQERERTDFCGFEDGQDWLDDLAIEDYLLNKERERNESKDKRS